MTTKWVVQIKESMFILTFFFALVTFTAKADVSYSIPLNGKEFKMGNRLEWSTSFEVNTSLFIIEKSEDGEYYDIAGDVQAAGESDEDKGYRFLDLGNNNEKTFYRLKLVDEDGGESISQTIIVNKKMQNNFQVLNMGNTHTSGTFDLFLDAQIEEEMTYALLDAKGETVFATRMNMNMGMNTLQVNLKDEPMGKYKLILKMKDETEVLMLRRVKSEEEKKQNVAVKSTGGRKG